MSLIEDKERLRAWARARRRTAHATAASSAAAGVKANFLGAMADMGFAAKASGDGRPAVSGYWPVGGELDLRPLLRALHERGFVCALPVVVAPGASLAFRRWEPAMVLKTARFGLRQPPAQAPPVTPEVVLAPLLAFDPEGHRLGQGGGYYDRTLAALRRAGPVVAVGIAFAAQRVERVPRGDGDERLDWIVTEAAATRFG